MPRQTEFDFDRAEQLGLLAEAVLPRGLGVAPATAKSVLRCIDDFGRGREAWPSVRTLAVRSNVTERTIKRALAALVRLSLLVVVKRRNRLGTVSNHYRIVWSELALLVPARAKIFCERGDILSERGDIESKRGDIVTPEAPRSAKEEPPRRAEEEGAAIVERAQELGVYSAALVREAAERTDWSHVAAILEAYDTQAYGPGALCLRLKRARPGLTAAAGWPPKREPVPTRRRDPALAAEMARARAIRARRARQCQVSS